MYSYRSFRNTDPPRIAQIWRSQPPQRGLIQPVTAGLLEQFVFSKQFFEPAGFIIALREGQPVGFAHATFGPNETESALSTELGTTQMLMVDAANRDSPLADDLLAYSEEYLRSRGTKVLYAGGINPLNAFYLGLYGGSELPGILASDPLFPQLVARHNYRQIGRVLILQREIISYKAEISRQQRQLRRDTVVEELIGPPPRTWWKAATVGQLDRLEYRLVRRQDRATLATVSFWDVEPLASSWGIRMAGMFDMQVSPKERRQGCATYLMGESFRLLRRHGFALVEAQTMQDNAAALALYVKQGFASVDCGSVFRKE